MSLCTPRHNLDVLVGLAPSAQSKQLQEKPEHYIPEHYIKEGEDHGRGLSQADGSSTTHPGLMKVVIGFLYPTG
jgi:hypothetical protein